MKDTIRAGLSGADPSAEIHSTDYFNHSFAPDYIMSWKHTSESGRYVYLRFNDDLGELRDDVDLVAGHEPVVVGLLPTPTDDSGRETVDSIAAQRNTLVTDSDALQALETQNDHEPAVRLLTSSLVQGGRGLIDDSKANSSSQTFVEGFRGARNLDRSEVAAVGSLLADVLSPAQAARVGRFLRALWTASGGPGDSFPFASELGGDLDDASLSFLLGTGPSMESSSFWRKIARGVTVEQLARLELRGFVPNLHRMVASNVDALWARACVVLPGGQLSIEQDMVEPAAYWTIKRGLLALAGHTFTAYLAATVDQLGAVEEHEPGRPLAVPLLLGRARDRGVSIEELLLTSGRRVLSYGSEDGDDDITDDEDIQAVAGSMSGDVRVKRATAVVSQRRLTVDFERRSTTAATSSKVPIRDIALVSLRLLHDPTATEGEAMEESFLPPDTAAGLLTGEG